MGLLDGLTKVFDSAVNFVSDHPILTATAVNAIAGALTPDQTDILKLQDKLKRKYQADQLARENQNWSVGNVDLGMKPSQAEQALNAAGTSTNPQQIINSGGTQPPPQATGMRSGILNNGMSGMTSGFAYR